MKVLTFVFLCLLYSCQCFLLNHRPPSSGGSVARQRTASSQGGSQQDDDRKCWCDPRITTYNHTNAIQIASVNNDGTLDFSGTEDLLTTLRSENYAGTRNVAIVGIVGAHRSGKSTLLNMLHRYMACQAQPSSNWENLGHSEWLHEDSNIPGCPRTFQVSSQQSLCTKGAWISKYPYIFGEQNLAVYLMDTQGFFDNSPHSKTTDSSVFYLASLLSSTLIFNVKGHLEKPLTEHIGAITLHLGRGVHNESDLESSIPAQGKPLQQLLLLIRDYHLQAKSGKEYLREYHNGHHRGAVEQIRQTWTDTEAFLLPIVALNPEQLPTHPNGLLCDIRHQLTILRPSSAAQDASHPPFGVAQFAVLDGTILEAQKSYR
ncbi:hypothetical protein RvY_08075-2 [Ramazzottius varieornatus]|uniref:GB1/RHD3-type G domain-containing protein n=1 Tax=Ramazzottius varieornatus TaxID=947166 RepID=A0A1D1VDS3_RAMVA|nr:hypothetical protein RvY_08075-2 [Ramazzottius varieornatus]